MYRKINAFLCSSIAAVALSSIVSVTHVYAADGEPAVEEVEDGEELPEELTQEQLRFKLMRKETSFEALPQGEDQPWKIIRNLQVLQDEIVSGVPFAQENYTEELKKASKVMLELEDDTWNFERNLDAIAMFMMFGGGTELGYKALKKTNLDIPQKVFLEAALSFVERDIGRANGLMQLIDYSILPPSMRAQLVLAKSLTLSSSSLKFSRQYLMEARRLAPSTLVEEAALRRLIRISGETKSFEDFKSFYGAYVSRFSKSHYFNDFVRNIGFAAVRMPRKNEGEVLALLDDFVEFIDARQTASLAVYVARYAAISARKKLSNWAEIHSNGKLRPDSKLHTRMELYAAASNVIQPEKTAETMKQLASLNRKALDANDISILDAVTSIGDRILMTAQDMGDEHEIVKAAPNRSKATLQEEEQGDAMAEKALTEHPTLSKFSKLTTEIDELLLEGAK